VPCSAGRELAGRLSPEDAEEKEHQAGEQECQPERQLQVGKNIEEVASDHEGFVMGEAHQLENAKNQRQSQGHKGIKGPDS
jgi:hypothetical protein